MIFVAATTSKRAPAAVAAFGGMRLGGGAVIVVVVISLLLGKNPLEILALLGDGGAPTVQTQAPSPTSSHGHPDRARQAEGFRGCGPRRYRGCMG